MIGVQYVLGEIQIPVDIILWVFDKVSATVSASTQIREGIDAYRLMSAGFCPDKLVSFIRFSSSDTHASPSGMPIVGSLRVATSLSILSHDRTPSVPTYRSWPSSPYAIFMAMTHAAATASSGIKTS